ncbi:MAG: PfkB family carbohydrate kinase, partial [Patescibacteria group bacterium]
SALITDGANGAYYMNQTAIYHQSAFKVNPVNTTGAGDAFGSGFLAGFINSNSNAKTALHLGMLNATAVIMHNGAQKGLLTKSELLKLKS